MFKLLKITIVLAFVCQLANAQSDSTKRQTLLAGKVQKIGFIGSLSGQSSQLNGSMTPGSSASMSLLFNEKFAVGLAGYGLGDMGKNLVVGDVSTRAGYGGLQLEYTMKPSKVFHLSFPLLIGAGMANLDTVSTASSSGWNDFDDWGKGRDGKGDHGGFRNSRGERTTFGVVQPGIIAELNVLKFATVFAGINYRIALNSSSTTLTNSDLSGLGVQVGIKAGLFGFSPSKLNPFRKKSRKED